jgi:hypothetical protein
MLVLAVHPERLVIQRLFIQEQTRCSLLLLVVLEV